MSSSESSFMRSVFAPAFVVGVVVMVLAGFGVRRGMAKLEAMNRKETIPMSRSFDAFDTGSLGSFAFLPKALPPIVGAGEIGTEDYRCLAFQYKKAATPPSFLVMTYYSNPQGPLLDRQGLSQLPDTGARIEDHDFLAAQDLETGGVPAVLGGGLAGARDGSANAPESNLH